MDFADVTFKSLAVLHTVAGYLFFGAATDEEFQQDCFYANCNPLAGDIKKYLVITASACLIACGILAFKIPVVAVALAWISLGLWFITGFVEVPWTRKLPGLCKVCAVNFAVRFTLAAGLTWLLYQLGG